MILQASELPNDFLIHCWKVMALGLTAIFGSPLICTLHSIIQMKTEWVSERSKQPRGLHPVAISIPYRLLNTNHLT